MNWKLVIVVLLTSLCSIAGTGYVANLWWFKNLKLENEKLFRENQQKDRLIEQLNTLPYQKLKQDYDDLLKGDKSQYKKILKKNEQQIQQLQTTLTKAQNEIKLFNIIRTNRQPLPPQWISAAESVHMMLDKVLITVNEVSFFDSAVRLTLTFPAGTHKIWRSAKTGTRQSFHFEKKQYFVNILNLEPDRVYLSVTERQ